MTQAAMLWKSYAKSKRQTDRDRLIEKYAPLAKYVVDRLNISLPPSLGYDDLVGQAVIGLIEAIDTYNPDRNVKFETYAYYRIRGSVIDMLREMDWLPRSLRRKERELAAVSTELENRLGRAPSEEEIAAELDVSPEELAQLNGSLSLSTTHSLNEIVAGADGEAVETMDLVADHEALTPDGSLTTKEDKRLLVSAIDALPEKEKMVVGLYYQEELTLKEIAEVLGVTESWVCQLHSRAISRLKESVASANEDKELAYAGSQR